MEDSPIKMFSGSALKLTVGRIGISIENIPVKINGIPGFRATFCYKNKDGLKIKSTYYGFTSGEWFYSLRYAAALRHYFEKDIETFEKVIKSFKLIKIA